MFSVVPLDVSFPVLFVVVCFVPSECFSGNLPVYLFICMCVLYERLFLSVSLFALFLSFCPFLCFFSSLRLSVCLCLFLSVYSTVFFSPHSSIYIFCQLFRPSVSLSVCSSIYFSVRISFYSSICPSVCLSLRSELVEPRRSDGRLAGLQRPTRPARPTELTGL